MCIRDRPMVYLSGAVGSLTGVTMGFFIGSFGRLNQNVKMAISMSVTMLSCFLSGLMIGNMKSVIEMYCLLYTSTCSFN